ncbi:GNAT family N-acetyltransferase [Enterococcus faecium]|uniref:GNAT family N-acetyltransferase n=1 Tax=Enterococcus faecium TaxID=1352 RepID=UPI000352D482|nr:GNAT family N-acetyltransferase [Enterococcus faecium]EPI13717.1 acetyltransferase, GNAT family [Enterococcus faecium SD3B-2]
MILETNRLILREWKKHDEKHLKKFLGDKRVMYAYNGAFNDQKIKEWLSWNLNLYQEKGYGLWAIETKTDGQVIGECGITDQVVGDISYLEIGYHLNFDFWHNGYITEAVQAVTEFAFENLQANEVVAIIRDTNIASMNVAIRNNMQIKERFIKHSNGIRMPHYLFSTNHKQFNGKR